MRVEMKTGRLIYPHPQHSILTGGNPNNPIWEEYIEEFKKEHRWRLEAIKELIRENGCWGATGEAMNDKYFEFDDGQIIAFTWRAWGDFMQAAAGKREGYMAYYM